MNIKPDLKHLIPHFTGGEAWRTGQVPVYVRGEGCYLWDDEGKKYFDGLAGLFVVQIGHGRSDLGHAAAKQMETLAYTPTWGAAHPPAIEASKVIAGLAPGDLDAIFFVSSGSEAVESAIKFARQYHASKGNPDKTMVLSREYSYHGTTMGALSATGLKQIRELFQPLLPGFHHVPSTLGYEDGIAAARVFEEAIHLHGPDRVGMIIAEPVQNGGGAIVPPDGYWQELRRICDEYDVLLAADEVINSFGRLGTWFGSDFVGVVPDLLTFAKGATSGYAPIGGLIVRRHLADQLLGSPKGTFTHGATWGGHPVVMAVAMANIAVMQEEKVVENARDNASYFRSELDKLANAHDICNDIRGAGYFYAIELCRSRKSSELLDETETKRLVSETLPGLITEAGLLIRADDRGLAKLMLSPPLIATPSELDELIAGVDEILERASDTIAT